MSDNAGAFMIIFMCVLVLCILAIRRKAEFLLNFILRGITGSICIYLVNQILVSFQITGLIGINPWTVLTSGILGIPGVALLYGINFINLL